MPCSKLLAAAVLACRVVPFACGADDLGEAASRLESTFAEKPIADRIADRDFPSVFMAWSPATNREDEDQLVTTARHDLVFVGPGQVGLRWNRSPAGLADGFQPKSIEAGREHRSRLLKLNPNLVLLSEIRYRDAGSRFLPADHAWWKRDESGKRIVGWEEGGYYLLDFANPVYQAHVAKQCETAVNTGVFDGVMLDWWRDDPDRIALLKAVRKAIGADALILVNANDRQTPKSAPYVNGYFMECWRSATRDDWDRIAQSLQFAERELRKPRINCLETWYDRSRDDLHRMRATTCLVLTQSDGCCLFSDPNGLPTPDHRHDWYSFWDAPLGKPLATGEIAEDGSSRREFEGGTAAYNPLGNKPMTVMFDQPRRSVVNGKTATSHTVRGFDGDLFLRVKPSPSPGAP
jgi:hypothetical protein